MGRPMEDGKHIRLEQLQHLLHPRVYQTCRRRYLDAHWKDAALASMVEVEQALRDAVGELEPARKSDDSERSWFGSRLVDRVWASHDKIRLDLPFGPKYRDAARQLFAGSFAYYRNYTAHEAKEIDEKTCVRVMILASELLDIIGASSRSFLGIGGKEGLLREHIFDNLEQLRSLLLSLHRQTIPDSCWDGFFEWLYEAGYTKLQFESVIDLGLVRLSTDMVPDGDAPGLLEMDSMQLTPQGRSIVGEGELGRIEASDPYDHLWRNNE